jgi:hypothetical protein
MSTVQVNEEAYFIPTRKIGAFTATVTISETSSDELEVTMHPVQQGANITDHAYLKQAMVSIDFAFDDVDTPLTETYEKLLKLQASREPFDVITGKRQYKNMLFKTLSVTNDFSTENILRVSADLIEVIITNVEVVSVPARSKQANAGKTGKTENAGEKKAQPVNRSQSGLRILSGAIR